MITKFKIYEKYDFSDPIGYFLNCFEQTWKKREFDYIKFRLDIYNIPKSLEYEFKLLSFLYEDRNYWAIFDNKSNDYVKNEVKKYVIKLLQNKIEDDITIYKDIENCLFKNKDFNNKGSFSNISDKPTKYFIFLLNDFFKNKIPEWIKKSREFNL